MSDNQSLSEFSQSLVYLAGYPEQILNAVKSRIQNRTLKDYLLQKYPQVNLIRSDKQLFEFVKELKNQAMKKESQLAKVHFDAHMKDLKGVLGTQTRITRVHGSKTKSKNEIKISTVFKEGPAEFLNMICAHELAHLREKDHNKAFYQLCTYMEPDYFMLELDTRIYLTYIEIFEGGLYE